jgi:bacterioferritin (cytochrome b1)
MIETKEQAIQLMNKALEHEWAVSIEYLIHAYSFPKGKFFYLDPIMKNKTDIRGQTIQIGIDEMYHALQLGTIITQMGGIPSLKTDEIRRFPKIIDNLKHDKMTEDVVTDLYQSADFKEGAFPEILNMALNISYDEVRHSEQFSAMIKTIQDQGWENEECYKGLPKNKTDSTIELLHEITRLENDLMHQYLKYVLLFSGHQDLTQRLLKNSINHMRHWDKNSGLLIKMGDVIRIENAEKDKEGVEISRSPVPSVFPGEHRLDALEQILPKEEKLIDKYKKLISLLPDGEIRTQLEVHLALNQEHIFTQKWLLENASKITGLK